MSVLRRAAACTEVYVCSGTVAGDRFELGSCSTDRWLGVPTDPPRWREAVHPDDLAVYDAALARACSGDHAEVDYRLCTPAGIRLVWDRMRATRNADGSIAINRLNVNVTDRPTPAHAAVDVRAQYVRLLETINPLAFEFDVAADGWSRASYMNAAIRGLLPICPAADGTDWRAAFEQRLHPDDVARAEASYGRVSRGEHVSVNLRLVTPDAVHRTFRFTCVPERTATGFRVATTGIDITDLGRITREMTMTGRLLARAVAREVDGPHDRASTFVYAIERTAGGDLVAYWTSGGMEEFTGTVPVDGDSLIHWRNAVVAEDQAEFDREFEAPVGIRRYRVRHPDGTVRLVEERFRRLAHENGNVGFEGLVTAVEGLRPRREDVDTPRTHRGILTDRQLEVLGLMCDGLNAKAIADRLWLSGITVRNHVTAIMTRLGVHTRAEAVAVAFRDRLVDSPSDTRG